MIKKTIKNAYEISLITSLLLLLSACQLIPNDASSDAQKHNHTFEKISYSDYYLWLKTLSSAELLIEVKEQQKAFALVDVPQRNHSRHQSKLLLIYSLPNPIVYQPYKAKTLLNSYHLPNNANSQTDANLVFMVMLRDQLNNQLHLLNEQVLLTKKHQQSQEAQTAEIDHLKKQLSQLKAIEKNINNHTSKK